MPCASAGGGAWRLKRREGTSETGMMELPRRKGGGGFPGMPLSMTAAVILL